MKRKNIWKVALVLVIAIAFILPGSAAFANIEDTTGENRIVVGVPITHTFVTSVEVPAEEKLSSVQFTATSGQPLGVDFPVFSTEHDCQSPGVVTDGFRNVLVLTEDVVDSSATHILGRWSTDYGESWVDEGSIAGFAFNDAVKKPKIDYNNGMSAWGIVVPGPDFSADVQFMDFPDITDPTVPSLWSPGGWTARQVKFGSYLGFSNIDSVDIACYPYTPGVSPSIQFWGCAALTGDSGPNNHEDDTMMFAYFLENNKTRIVHFYNMPYTVEKISCDIDKSLGQYYWVCEFTSDIGPEKGSYFVKPPVFDGTEDWWEADSGFPGLVFNYVYSPDMLAANGSVYIVGEAYNEIMCFYSTDAGETFDSSFVTDTVVDELHPTIALVEDTLICSYVRAGDLYVSISTDGGQTWGDEELINDQAGTVVEQYSTAAMDGPYAAWTDGRNTPTEIYFDTTVEPPMEPYLEITKVTGGLGVSATINNTVGAVATNVSWSIVVEGGLLGLIDVEKTGVIPCLAVGESELVKTGLFFGFGVITILIAVDCDEGSSTTKSVEGTQLIVFTVVRE